jgi:acetyl esterase
MPSDPEVVAFIERTLAFYPADTFGYTTVQNRALYDRYAAAFRAPRPTGITSKDFDIPAFNPDRRIGARIYQGPTVKGGVVLYFHGGGFVLGGLESHDDVCAELADKTGLEVVSIDYRLAPEHLHPAQLDDAESAFLWLTRDWDRILVAGDSAGGNLAAALCLRRRATGGRQPDGQILSIQVLVAMRMRDPILRMPKRRCSRARSVSIMRRSEPGALHAATLPILNSLRCSPRSSLASRRRLW